MHHPDTRVEIRWESKEGFECCLITTYENLKTCLIEIFEDIIVDNVDNVFYTMNGITKKLDYYNAEL